MALNIHSDTARASRMLFQSIQSFGLEAGAGFATLMKHRNGGRIHGGSGDDRIYVNGTPDDSGDGTGNGEPVAANEHGRIWNDPHCRGGDGGRFDVQGEAGKTYNLFSDTGVQMNARFDEYNGDGTCVGETGLTVTGDDGETSEIGFSKDGTATYNGEAMEQGKQYTLADGGTAVLDGKKLTVTTAEGYTIEQQAKSWGDEFINVDFYTGANGVDNGQMPGGLIGHTFDADNNARNGKTGHGAQGEGAIDGVIEDYETDGLFSEADETVTQDAVIINGGSGDDRIVVNGPVDGPIVVNGGSGDDVIIIGTEPDLETSPVAANETGTIKGDPHFTGGDGGKYDIQGEAGKIYDVLSDSGLDMRAQFDAWGNNGATVVGETGLTVGDNVWNSDNINFRKDGTARINGQLMEEGRTYDLADGGTAILENGALAVTTAEGYTIKQTAEGSGDKAYINIEVTTGEDGVDNGQMPGGLLGQSFDADNVARNGSGSQGEGAIEGDVSDYEKSALDPINDNRGHYIPDVEYDPVSSEEDKMETHTFAGSGDDTVNIFAAGNHTVELGSGDDQVYVDFEDGDTGNSATIHGGSGDDTVTLAGSESDYTVSHKDGYAIYTDKDGNAIRIAEDVEQIRFEAA